MDFRDYVVGTLARIDERSKATAEDLTVMKRIQARIESTVNEQHAAITQRVATLEERTPPGTTQVAAVGAGSGMVVVLLEWIVRNLR